MDDDIYSIGETAKLNDISIKALRHYDEIGLLKPRYTDAHNGYRYYTYDQFSFIDKIKRYKNIGMPLKDLKVLFQTKDISIIETFLEEQKKNLEQEMKCLEEKKQNVQWMHEFFAYSKTLETTTAIYTKYIDKRTVLRMPCDDNESIYDMDMQLRNLFSLPEFRTLQILNPYGYILDFGKLTENKFSPKASTVSVSGTPIKASPYYMTLPAGNYVCCQSKVLSSEMDVLFFTEYCREHNYYFDEILAFEYLKSLYDPLNSPYELQALLK